MNIKNFVFDEKRINKTDCFVCAVNNEERSTFLLNIFMSKISPERILIFELIDFSNNDNSIDERYKVIKVKYDNKDIIPQATISFLSSFENDSTVYIDYSSMPRGSYCQLPTKLVSSGKKLAFLYVEGDYSNYDSYPNSGINAFQFFAGKPSLRVDCKRTHIFCLNFDYIRTNAIVSLLDPDRYVACTAFDSKRISVSNYISDVNKSLINRAFLSLSFRMEDFVLMLSRLCEISYKLVREGDVILVPDGPKPFIMAASLVPIICDNTEGISCLHITKNLECYEPINIKPYKELIIGFSVTQ